MNDLSAPLTPDGHADEIASAARDDAPAILVRPVRQTVPLVFVSAHSGAAYSDAFLAQTRLDPLTLRRSEDCYVDQLFRASVEHGAPLVAATFPRAFCDANRDAWELDPAMFRAELPAWVDTRSPRAAAGFGTIPRLVAAGVAIYDAKLHFAEAQARIATCWTPFHAALRALVEETRDAFGRCVVIDCHSMPRSVEGGRRAGAAYVLGDAHGSSASADMIAGLDRAVRATGRSVARNDPYAGGYITRHYGRPGNGVHALQIEVARDLYLDDLTLEPSTGFAETREEIAQLVGRFAAFVATLA